MPIISIDNVGSQGLIEDSVSRELPPEAWSEVLNARFKSDIVEKSHTEEAVFGTLSIVPNWIKQVVLDGVIFWLYADATRMFKTDGATHTEITRAAGNYTAGTDPQWNGCVLGGVPILNNTGGTNYPQSWNTATGKMIDLPNWPVNFYAKVIRSFKQYAIALYLTDTGVTQAYSLRWSQPADPGTVPTSWDISDATKDCGQVPLSETSDFLVDCLPLGDTNIVYKTDTTWAMQFVGGQSIFSFRKLFSDVGMLSQDCAAIIPSGHFVVTNGDIIVHNGQTYQSVSTKRVRQKLFGTLSGAYAKYTHVAVNTPFKEVWVFYVQEGAAIPVINSVLIWNWENQTWTEREVPAAYYASEGKYFPASASNTFDSAVGTFDTDTDYFNQGAYSSANSRLVMGSVSSSACYLADQGISFDGTDYQMILERTGLGIVGKDRQGNWKVNQEAVKFIRNIYPKITAAADISVSIYIGMQLKQNDVVSWQGPFAFDPQVDTKIDCTITTKLLSVRFVFEGAGLCRFLGYDIDMDVTARY